ncbi:MAG: helix-hairpin-helix domain-containing protein, partial [Planctomycetota bacterium]
LDLCESFRNTFTRAAEGDARDRAESISETREAVAELRNDTRARLSAATPDDLTAIQGIGPKTQERLSALGIDSFAALAEADPAELAAGLDGRRAGVKTVRKWIASAKKKQS